MGCVDAKLSFDSAIKRRQIGVAAVERREEDVGVVRGREPYHAVVCFQHAVRLAARFLPRKAFEHGSHHEKELVSQPGLVGGLWGGGGGCGSRGDRINQLRPSFSLSLL